MSGYAPFGNVASSDRFGLELNFVDTHFGRMRIAAGPRRTETARVFLHGAGGSWETWSPLLQTYETTDQSVSDHLIFDLPGFGESVNTAGHLRAEVVGREILRIAQSLGWSSLELVGHSMGGFLALAMGSFTDIPITRITSISGSYLSVLAAATHPLSALVKSPGSAVPYLGMRALASFGPLGKILAQGAQHVGVLPWTLRGTIAHPNLIDRSLYKVMAEGVRPKAFALAANNARGFSPTASWGRIHVPVTLTFGANDSLVPESDGVYAQSIMGGQVTCKTIQDCGHFAVFERPFELAELISRANLEG